MRQIRKKQLLEGMETLRQAENYIAENHLRNSGAGMTGVLADMQELACKIGDALEECCGTDCQAIRFLEQYCELLWQYDMADGKIQRAEIFSEMIAEHDRFQAFLEEIPGTWEIAFFPYKASMWDSMESIWTAAENKEDCQVSVVPIPYYERKPDGGTGRMIYEGDRLPSCVPVMDWRRYSVESQKPDAAFIHNPYDGGNYVTVVDSRFFSGELKKYAGMLIYVPYFIFGTGVYQHLTLSPGIVNADKVILQSERVREIHIQSFRKFVTDHQLSYSDTLIEDKFLALGSPKIDQVLHTDGDREKLPVHWRAIIDGKKAVLYNTGISGLLNGNEQELIKILDVIELFRKRRDAVLWWRPHPLEESACASMRPRLLERYNKIVSDFRESRIGIFDDTPDLHRAIACTDLYYGDESSLVTMYGLTGKPVLMQNLQVLTEDQKAEADQTICIDSCVSEDGTVWFSSGNYNGLYEMDLESGQIRFLGRIPGEDERQERLYEAILKIEGKLWLIPGRALELAVYDLRTGEFTKYPLPEELRTKSTKFRYAFYQKGSICMIPGNYPAIACFDIKNTGIKLWDDWVLKARSSGGREAYCFFSYGSPCAAGDKVYFAYYNTNLVVEFDLHSSQSRIYRVGKESFGYAHIAYDGRNFWLAPRTGNTIVCWDKKRDEIQVLPPIPSLSSIQSMVCIGNNIWLIPVRGRSVFLIHTEDKAIEEMTLSSEEISCSFIHSAPGEILIGIHQRRGKGKILRMRGDGGGMTAVEAVDPKPPAWTPADIFEKNRGANYLSADEYRLWETKDVRLDEVLDSLTKQDGFNEEQREQYGRLFVRLGESGEAIMERVLACLREGDEETRPVNGE